MFGFWKDRARQFGNSLITAQIQIDALNVDLDEARRAAANMETERDAARKACDRLEARRAEAVERGNRLHDLGLNTLGLLHKSEAKAKELEAKLADAQHCYEQCEIDRQALADERDAARRDLVAIEARYHEAVDDLQNIHALTRGHAASKPENDGDSL